MQRLAQQAVVLQEQSEQNGSETAQRTASPKNERANELERTIDGSIDRASGELRNGAAARKEFGPTPGGDSSSQSGSERRWTGQE